VLAPRIVCQHEPARQRHDKLRGELVLYDDLRTRRPIRESRRRETKLSTTIECSNNQSAGIRRGYLSPANSKGSEDVTAPENWTKSG